MTVQPPPKTALPYSKDPASMSSPNGDMKLLTSLRFFAAAWVVFFHFGATALSKTAAPDALKNIAMSGYLGVSFFFILSGFILTSVYRTKIKSISNVSSYMLARFARIYPVYILSLLATLPYDGPKSWAGAILSLVLLQSWAPASTASLFSWNTPTWTLSVELLFYIAFIPLAGLLPKLDRRIVASVLALSALLIAALGLAGIAPGVALEGPMAYTPLALLRLPEFLFGCCLAELFCRASVLNRQSYWDWGLAAAAVALAGLCGLTGDAFRWAPLLFGSIIIFGAMSVGPLGRILSNPFLVLLGGASFVVYLLQDAINGVFDALFGTNMVFRILMPLALFAVSVGIYRWYEEPARRFIRKTLGRPA